MHGFVLAFSSRSLLYENLLRYIEHNFFNLWLHFIILIIPFFIIVKVCYRLKILYVKIKI